MTIKEEKELIKLAQSNNTIASENAMTILLQAHSGLVNSIANKFSGYEVEFDDLYLLGQLGLINAIKKYNLKSTNKLITYAYLEIVQSIQKGLTDRNMIYIPDKQLKLYWTIESFKTQYYNEHKCYPSIELIAKTLKLTKSQVLKNTRVINCVYSMDKTINKEREITSATTIADDKDNPLEFSIKNEAIDQFYDCLKKSLSDRQYKVISWSYGLDPSIGKLEAKDIAKRLKLSVPAVRKIQYGSLALLKQVKEMTYINESMQ